MPQESADCPESLLTAVLALAEQRPDKALVEVGGLCEAYPADARLHFLLGSLLAGDQQYELARNAMARATELAPNFALAHFQLGFLHITSGEVSQALEAWQGLADLDNGDPLRLFANGLAALARDDFGLAKSSLEAGIATNLENPALNRDMALILDQLGGPPVDEPTSSTHLLLQQYTSRQTRH